MSVINKMLRDLDQRQAKSAASGAPAGGLHAQTTVLRGFNRSLSAPGEGSRRMRPLWLVVACAALVLVVGASWWVSQRVMRSVQVPVPVPAPVPVAPAVATSLAPFVVPPVAAASAPIPAPAATAALATSVVASNAPTTEPTRPAAPPAGAALSAAPARREPATLGLRMDTTLALQRLAERVPAAERANPQAGDSLKAPTPNEALERAQALWNSGAREAAIDLLQDAVAVAERAGTGGVYPQGNPVLLPLVRELTRYQLVESRHAAVWDVLTRLEPQLGSVPELWAIRGNAAQRLGRHQDSVHAYMVALQSRPHEQRWLLGAAVSLAALGQTTSAAEMADKARAVAVVSPDVLVYLRQMGVPLKDK